MHSPAYVDWSVPAPYWCRYDDSLLCHRRKMVDAVQWNCRVLMIVHVHISQQLFFVFTWRACVITSCGAALTRCWVILEPEPRSLAGLCVWLRMKGTPLPLPSPRQRWIMGRRQQHIILPQSYELSGFTGTQSHTSSLACLSSGGHLFGWRVWEQGRRNEYCYIFPVRQVISGSPSEEVSRTQSKIWLKEGGTMTWFILNTAQYWIWCHTNIRWTEDQQRAKQLTLAMSNRPQIVLPWIFLDFTQKRCRMVKQFAKNPREYLGQFGQKW